MKETENKGNGSALLKVKTNIFIEILRESYTANIYNYFFNSKFKQIKSVSINTTLLSLCNCITFSSSKHCKVLK